MIASLNFDMALERSIFDRCLHQNMSLKYYSHEDLVSSCSTWRYMLQ